VGLMRFTSLGWSGSARACVRGRSSHHAQPQTSGAVAAGGRDYTIVAPHSLQVRFGPRVCFPFLALNGQPQELQSAIFVPVFLSTAHMFAAHLHPTRRSATPVRRRSGGLTLAAACGDSWAAPPSVVSAISCILPCDRVALRRAGNA
jgi:hypothetical protein